MAGFLSSIRQYLLGPYDLSFMVDTGRAMSIQGLPSVERAIDGVSGLLASVSLCAYDQAGKEADPAPLRLLTGTASALVTGHDLRKWMVSEAFVMGNAYVYIARTLNGEPAELIPLDRGRVLIDWSRSPIRYKLDGKEVDSADIIHIKASHSRWAFLGESPLDKCKVQLELLAKLDAWAASMAQSGTTRRLAFRFPTPISDTAKQSVIAGWKAKLSREGGASEPLVVDGGATIEGVSGANDMESITSARTAAMAEVARALGVPYAFLAAAEAGTQIDLAATRTLCDQTLFPWARRIENELQEKLFPGYRLEHDLTELKRGSIKEHARDLAKLVMAGVLTPNDARWFLGVEPHEDGDELTVRLDTVNGQAVHNDEQQEDETNEAGDN